MEHEKLEVFKIAKELFLITHPVSNYSVNDINEKYLADLKKFVDTVFNIYTTTHYQNL